jgi:hypothetical protein
MKNLIPTELHAVLVELYKSHHSAIKEASRHNLAYAV